MDFFLRKTLVVLDDHKPSNGFILPQNIALSWQVVLDYYKPFPKKWFLEHYKFFNMDGLASLDLD